MRAPYWNDPSASLYLGDAVEVVREMPTGSVDCVVTSPPYWGLRDYGVAGQYGHEPTPEEYVAALRRVFGELRRVLAADGTVWLNLGDGYAATPPGKTADPMRHSGLSVGGAAAAATLRESVRSAGVDRSRCLPPKNLIGMPWRVAFALQADGWIIRNAIVWHKTNGMPESVKDRLACRYELLFLLVKQRRYHFNLDAIRQPYRHPVKDWGAYGGTAGNTGCTGSGSRTRTGLRPGGGKYASSAAACRGKPHGSAIRPAGRKHDARHLLGRNPGDVWSIATRPFREAHFATFPIDIPLRCIAAGCRAGGTVLDPFAGAATTGLAARQLARQFVGIDLSPAYLAIAARRLGAFGGGVV